MVEPINLMPNIKLEVESDDEFQNENPNEIENARMPLPEITTLSSFNIPTSSHRNILPKGNETVASPHISHGNIPANNDWAGEYGFNISFAPHEKNTRCTNWTYSDIKNKLYVNIAVPCPIRFHVLKTPPEGSVIRALPIFSKPEHIMDVVKRCLNHSLPTDPLNEGHPAPDHLIRCDDDFTDYTQDLSTGRLSVTVPYKSPQVGMEYSTYLFRFMCLGSCVGGLNRRPLQLAFTLEKDGCCLGRRVIDVRICACPGRDRRIEEKCYEDSQKDSNKRSFSRNFQESSFSDQVATLKKQKSSSSDDEYVLISIKRSHYEFIKKTLDGLDALEMLTPEMKANLHQKQIQRVVATAKKHKKGSSSDDEII
ncbi:tumor protein 63-like isoform X2 [Centruroides vittatus]|uniref:tumor protein 63-like isoform X2 n=1 Tax=Centruroides vittatus TaxID=120091 RepID=UPI00350F0C35